MYRKATQPCGLTISVYANGNKQLHTLFVCTASSFVRIPSDAFINSLAPAEKHIDANCKPHPIMSCFVNDVTAGIIALLPAFPSLEERDDDDDAYPIIVQPIKETMTHGHMIFGNFVLRINESPIDVKIGVKLLIAAVNVL